MTHLAPCLIESIVEWLGCNKSFLFGKFLFEQFQINFSSAGVDIDICRSDEELVVLLVKDPKHVTNNDNRNT